MKATFFVTIGVCLVLPLSAICHGQELPLEEQLHRWLKQFPAADTNSDGKLSVKEAIAYRDKIAKQRKGTSGAKRDFKVDPGWELEKFPEHAVSYKTPPEIKDIYERRTAGKQPAVVSFEKPQDGALRVVGIGHSFMAPGYRMLPSISKGAGMNQPLYTHIGGGMTGSARYKWEQENGIFQFDGKPLPKLLASIANAEWEAMMFGPYYNDRAAYYSCWFDFCLRYNPDMKFYISDAWPQLEQLGENPKSEAYFTAEVLDQMGKQKQFMNRKTLDPLLKAYPDKVFVLPTSDAMVLAAKHFIRGELPGVEGLHRVIGGKERSLWKDQLGHLGPGFERLEGYVFYATLYGQSPELIEGEVDFPGGGNFPSRELDHMFRKIAWQAVRENPFSGVSDNDNDGISDPKVLETSQ